VWSRNRICPETQHWFGLIVIDDDNGEQLGHVAIVPMHALPITEERASAPQIQRILFETLRTSLAIKTKN